MQDAAGAGVGLAQSMHSPELVLYGEQSGSCAACWQDSWGTLVLAWQPAPLLCLASLKSIHTANLLC